MIIIGKINAPYGLRGWMKINSFTEPEENIFEYLPWHTGKAQTWQPAPELIDAKKHGTGYIIQLAGIINPEDAKKYYQGQFIGVPREQLPDLKDEDDYYWNDLIGLTVIDHQGHELGLIINLMETGSNDVLIIQNKNKQQILIPFIMPEYVTRVDLISKQLFVKWELD